MLVATKFERKQMRATFAYGATYIAWNIVWFLVGTESEKVIYSPMDWGEDLGGAILFAVVILFVLVPVYGLIHYGVYRCVITWVGSASVPYSRVCVGRSVCDIELGRAGIDHGKSVAIQSTECAMAGTCLYLRARG